MTLALYTDGGVIGQNPSRIGGTWAWCEVDSSGQRMRTDSGIIMPGDAGLGAITNNLTELLALVNGLEALSAHWEGVICSDSWVSLQRVFLGAKLMNVPPWLVDRLRAIQRSGRLGRMTYKLLDGHPTQAQLATGKGKRGGPVSIHNVWCDSECQRLARAY